MPLRHSNLAALAMALAVSTAAVGAEPNPTPLKPGLWKGEAVNSMAAPGPAEAAVLAVVGRIPLTKCVSPDLAARGALAVLQDGTDCQIKASTETGKQITADQICRDESGKESVSKVVIAASQDKMVVTITGVSVSGQKSPQMKITDTMTWFSSSCG